MCRECHCLFLDPMPGKREIDAFYPDQYWWSTSRPGALKKLESVYRRIALRDHLAFIMTASQGRSGARVLDVGCGSGTLLGLLKVRGFDVTGLDMSEQAAHAAESDNGVRVIVGSLEQVGLPGASFDVVTMFHVMEHVTNPRALLREVFRILKRNGRVVLQVPNIDSWQFRMFGPRWYGLDIPRHVIDYSGNSILKLLADSGFATLRVRHFNLRDNAPALVSSLFPSLDPVSRAVRHRRLEIRECLPVTWLRHLLYLSLVIAAYPVAILEAASGHGATVTIEAAKT